MARIQVDTTTPVDIPEFTPPGPGAYIWEITGAEIYTDGETDRQSVMWGCQAAEAEDAENVKFVGKSLRHFTTFYAPQALIDRITLDRRQKNPDAKEYDPRAMLMGFLVDIGAGSKNEAGQFVDNNNLFGSDGGFDLDTLTGHRFHAMAVEVQGKGEKSGERYTNLKRIRSLEV